MKCIEIIGEAAAKIGPEVRAQYADIPWADIVGMRNRLIHAYFDIDLGLLYETVTGDLPPL
ncbi:MAG: HepT-like ribonuclease domain-containing protein, partial [Gammaproteobacteria bacterium]